MALYHNHTRFDAVVTVRLTSVQDPSAALKVGIESALKPLKLPLGVHDLTVPPAPPSKSPTAPPPNSSPHAAHSPPFPVLADARMLPSCHGVTPLSSRNLR